MPEIIKQGDASKKIPAGVGTELACERCGCVWKLTDGDKVSHNYYEPDIAITFCPTCGKKRTFADYVTHYSGR